MKKNKKYDLIVIGAGSAGLVSAAGAAGLGAKVALIERDKMGGDCLNTGCVPSKAIIRSANLIHDIRRGDQFGLKTAQPEVNFSEVMQSVRNAKAKIEPHDSPERFRSLGVDVFFGNYKFLSEKILSDGEHILIGKRFVIATGASPFVPPIKGIDTVPYLTSDTVWDLKELPKKFLVLGGGPIGSELAQVFSRLGSSVEIVEGGDCILNREDPEASCLLKDLFEKEGVKVHTNSRAIELKQSSNKKTLVVDHSTDGQKTIPFDQILIAVGRAPRVNDLALEVAGIKYTKRGVTVNAKLQTTNKNIYACGDIIAPYQFTHTADHEARLVLRNALFPGSSKIDYKVVPWCTFTSPELARVGLNETEAKSQNIQYDVYQYSMSGLDRAICDRETEGFIKVLCKKGSDSVLGVTLLGYHAGDLIHEFVLAIKEGIGLKKIAGMIHIYPTRAEISKRVADDFQRSKLSPTLKKLLKGYFRFLWR